MSSRDDSFALCPILTAMVICLLNGPGWIMSDVVLLIVVTLVCGLWARYRAERGRFHRAFPRVPDVAFDQLGVEFPYKGDVVIWTWPWTRDRITLPWISLGFTGNGDFGDARYATLADVARAWDEYLRHDVEYDKSSGTTVGDFDGP